VTLDPGQLWYVGTLRWSGEFSPDDWQLAIIDAEAARQTQHLEQLGQWLAQEHDHARARLGLPVDDSYDPWRELVDQLHTERGWLAEGQSLDGVRMVPEDGDFAVMLSDMARGPGAETQAQFAQLIQRAFEKFRHGPAMQLAEEIRQGKLVALQGEAEELRRQRRQYGRDNGQCIEAGQGSPTRTACAKRQVAQSMAESMRAALSELRFQQDQAAQFGVSAHEQYIRSVADTLEVAVVATEDLVLALDRQIDGFKSGEPGQIEAASGLVARAEARTAQAQLEFEQGASQDSPGGGPSLALVWGGIILAASGVALLAGVGADAADRTRKERQGK
jgi:hypothetical protein